MRAQNVGIHAMETYFPKTFISQEELEQYNKVGKGKYTIGLMQKEMAFVQGFEDINSISLTVVKNLLEKYNIDPRKIGRLEVGTETLIDKSKSTKTVLMQLFKEYGNHDIEGVTSINACYGGTAALLNTLAWVESSAWDGRYGIIITSDIAVYKKGPARPTGGAGATAMLIGPDAPISFENLRSSFVDHQYDFYKPDPRSEYPTVDGHISMKTYVNAIEHCYESLRGKQAKNNMEKINLGNVDYACFHAPFGKMVQKAFIKLVYRDVLNGDLQVAPEIFAEIKGGNYDSKPVQAHLSKISKDIWNKKVQPSLALGSKIGNIYTGSLYAGLASIISDPSIDLRGKRIFMFSYGSGLASTMFILKVNRSVSHIAQMMNIHNRLANRIKYPIQEFEDIMSIRETKFGAKNYKVEANLDQLEDGTYYLTEVDDMFRRNYLRKPHTSLKTFNIDTPTQIFSNSPQSDFLSLQQQQLKNTQLEISVNNEHNSRLSGLNTQMKQSNNSQAVNKQQQSQEKMLWNGFYKKTLKERLDQMQKIDHDFESSEYLQGGLDIQKADIMVENCIGKISLPMGLGLNININGKEFQVPMAVEEPSVIAAASSAGKFISDKGTGFITHSSEPIMIGQIQLLDITSQLQLTKISNNKSLIIEKANQSCQNMVKRGGGVLDLRVRQLHSQNKNVTSTGLFQVSQMAVVDLFINVCDSMGANIVNTICEQTAPIIEEIAEIRTGIKILSNLCTERMAVCEFQVPVSQMGWKSASGEQVAQKMIESYNFAQLDIYRAATHNKGIMNGIDAVAIALGQDWRQIEAAVHSYASINQNKSSQTYQPLSHYEIIENENKEVVFKGKLEIPIAIGTRGGVIDNNKIYQNNLRLLGYPNSQQLAEIMTSVGLAQNFAALRALAMEGIQKGHMSLHAKNIAISSGVPAYLAEDAARFMQKRGKINGDTAKEYVLAYDLFDSIRNTQQNKQKTRNQAILSSFYVELQNLPNLNDETVSLHIALDCPQQKPIHITMLQDTKENDNVVQIHNKIFGEKGYQWLIKMFSSLDLVRLDTADNDVLPSNKDIVPKIKLITILIDLIVQNMLEYSQGITCQVLELISKQGKQYYEEIQQLLIRQHSDTVLQYGLTLLTELFRIFNYNLEQHSASQLLKETLLQELFTVCQSQVISKNLWINVKAPQESQLQQFQQNRQKRLCATMMLLSDCLNLKQQDVNLQYIQVLKELGNIYEIEITCVRDLQKWSLQNVQNNINLYTFWLRNKNISVEDATQKKNIDLFINEYKEQLKSLRSALKPRLNEKQVQLCEKTSQVIKNYYKLDNSILQQGVGKQNYVSQNLQAKPRL